MKPPQSPIFDKPDLHIGADEVLLFSNVRNEGARLPYFFSYYRRLGVSRFFIVDNGSTDDTAAIVRAQPDTHYFHTTASYAVAAGRNWTTELATHYGMNRWCFVADADELFVFPGVEFLSIRDLIEYLDANGHEGAYGVFLDMYHPGKLSDAQYVSGEPFLNTCSWFDRDSYWLSLARFFPRVDISGGPRWRKFWSSKDAGVGPTMRKHILVKWRPGFDYLYSTHSMKPIRLADFTTAVLHFKFFSNFSTLAQEEHGRADRFRMDHYAVYKDAISKEAALDFTHPGGEQYANSSTLARCGFLSVPESFAEFMARKANDDLATARYRSAIDTGFARDLPASPTDLVKQIVEASEKAQETHRISLNQLCSLWPLLSASVDSAQQSAHAPQRAPKQAPAARPASGPTPKEQKAQGGGKRGGARTEVGFDLTVGVTAHAETVIAGPTMLSCEAAIRAAEANGIRVERLICLDAATPDCRAYFMQSAYASWQIVEFDERDVGLTRNAMAPLSSGRWVAFLDADDLFSENWLLEGARRLKQAAHDKQRVIVHPEINWHFDGSSSVFTKPEQDDPLFSPYYFYFANYYDSLCMAPREAHLDIPYVRRDIPNGLSFQDWQWNIETMAAGWRHVAATDTIIFKRRRDSSLVTESSARKSMIRAIPSMRIDRVNALHRQQS